MFENSNYQIRGAVAKAIKSLVEIDGKILDVEVATAEAILGLYVSDKATNFGLAQILDAPMEDHIWMIGKQPVVARHQFLSYLWILAQCDGKLHAKEHALILYIADQIGVDERTALKLRPEL